MMLLVVKLRSIVPLKIASATIMNVQTRVFYFTWISLKTRFCKNIRIHNWPTSTRLLNLQYLKMSVFSLTKYSVVPKKRPGTVNFFDKFSIQDAY